MSRLVTTCSSREGSHTAPRRLADVDLHRAARPLQLESQVLDDLAHQGPELESHGIEVEATALDTGHVEELVGEPPQALGAVPDAIEVLPSDSGSSCATVGPRLQQY